MKTFIAGEIASAADVNANFAELSGAIGAIGQDVSSLITLKSTWPGTLMWARRFGKIIIASFALTRSTEKQFDRWMDDPVASVASSIRPKALTRAPVGWRPNFTLAADTSGEIYITADTSYRWMTGTYHSQIMWEIN